MDSMNERKKKSELRRENALWQRAVAGLFVLSLAVNAAQVSQIRKLYAERKETAEQIQKAEETRDYAIQQLGEMAIQIAHERQEHEEKAASEPAAVDNSTEYQYMGEFAITAYCPCEKCCGEYADGFTASGVPAEPGVIAVDASVISLGSTVIIEGKEYLAADVGGGVKGNHIDICFEDHSAAENFGVQMADVWVVAG